MNNRILNIFNHVLVTVSSIGIYTKGSYWHIVAICYFSLYVLTGLLRIRQEFLFKQKTREILDAVSRITPGSREEIEAINYIVSQEMVSITSFSSGKTRTTAAIAQTYSRLNMCTSCKFWHGKNSIVCAVHPSGYLGDSCTDFEESHQGRGG